MNTRSTTKVSKVRTASKDARSGGTVSARTGKDKVRGEPAKSVGAVTGGTFRVVNGFPVDTTGRHVLPTPLKSKVGAKLIAKAVKAVIGA